MSKFLSSKYKNLKPYTPGEQPKEREYIKLNTNESPFPPSPLAIKLGLEQMEKSKLYPDPDCKELLTAISEKYGVDKSEIIVTNGSDEVLNFAFMAFCDEQTPAIFPDITYGFYKVFADLNGVSKTEIPLKEDFTIDVEDYINKDGVVFIANPNAPTGLCLKLAEIEKLLSANLERIVVIDEAYVDFGGESCVPLIKKYKNLLVTQTFSKSRSMAGARLGVGFANNQLIADLMAIKYSTNPYNVNRVTTAMGVGAIKDNEYFERNCKAIIKTREWLKGELENIGFTLTESKTNFLFAKTEKIGGKDLYLKLKENGILIRHFDSERTRDYIRITIGSREDMEKFLSTVKDIIGDKI